MTPAVEENAPPPPPAQVPAPAGPKVVSFSTSDVPIQAVTVFCKNEAEVTRVVKFSSPSSLGRHEVELTDLPGRAFIDGTSVRVKGSGHCTILHVSYSDEPKDVKTELTQEEKDAAQAKREKTKEDIQRLKDELKALEQQSARNTLMREYADRFAERTVNATAGGSAHAASVVAASDNGPPPSVDDVGKALDWWAARAVQTDAEVHRLELESRRLKNAINELQRGQVVDPNRLLIRMQAMAQRKEKQGRVLVTIDVQELSPIELQVKYMTKGATWSPSYDLRVDTQTDSVSCTYYGMVSQNTTEDWNGVALRLSTAEPTIHGTPPTLGSKTVALKTVPLPVPKPMGKTMKKRMSTRGCSEDLECDSATACGMSMMSSFHSTPQAACSVGGGGGGYGGVPAPGAPPPPPPAKRSVALVEGGGGGIGAVSFVVEKTADIKSDKRTKKMTIGILQLSAEVTHYVVPAKEAAAYLQAKATNNTDYLLLASDDVSIFFDNSFVTKTSLTSVSPGESFQTFLGIDPAVKINVAPVRKTSKKRGTFSKSNQVTYTHSTSISNKKKVPVTCVIVDAMPRSTNDVIKVTLKQPAPASVSDSHAINDDVLVSVALEMFGGGDANGGQQSWMRVNAGVTGVLKSPTNHLAWVGKIVPQGEISIPLEFTLEWPSDKEIEISE